MHHYGMLYLWLLQWYHLYASVQSFLTPAELCPARSFCTTNATTVIASGEKDSCCQSCSCDADCYVVGNCCHDVTLPDNLDDKSQIPCVDLMDLLNAENNLRSDQIDSVYVRIFTSCPPMSNVSNELIEQCNAPRENIPVSSVDGNRLYRNQYCAICHGEQGMVPWQIYTVECPELLQQEFTGLKEMNDFIWENCELMAQAPGYLYIRNVGCNYESRATCNSTGDWDVYDANIENACLTKAPRLNDAYYYQRLPAPPLVFENIYCYLCNTKNTREHPLDECDRPTYKDIRMYWWTVLLHGLPPGLDSPQPNKVSKCPNAEYIYDPYMKKCRPVMCNVGMLPSNGQCQEIVRVGTYGIHVYMLVVSTSGRNNHSVDTAWMRAYPGDIAHAFYNSLNTIFNSKCTIKCVCSVDLYLEATGTWALNANLRTYGKCEYYTLLDNAIQLAKKPLEFTVSTPVESRTVVVEAELTESEILFSQYEHVFVAHKQVSCSTRKHKLHHANIQLCPRIQVTVAELPDHFTNETVAQLIEARINSSDTSGTIDTFKICLASYMAIMEDAMGRGHILYPGLLSWAVLLLKFL